MHISPIPRATLPIQTCRQDYRPVSARHATCLGVRIKKYLYYISCLFEIQKQIGFMELYLPLTQIMSMGNFIILDKTNSETEHICCAISDKKCAKGYQLKKMWLSKEIDNGYKFIKLNARAKVFIEYGPSETAWVPIAANNYLVLGCFWVSGQYKGHGYGKQLLQFALDDARLAHKDGLIAIAGSKKKHFMSDGKWLMKQGFEVIETLPNGLAIFVKRLNDKATLPTFNPCTKKGSCQNKNGLVVYYSNRCPFTEYHVNENLVKTAKERNIALEIIKISSYAEAQACPSPATIFSLFYKGQFVTTDVSICDLKKFNKMIPE